MTAARDDDFMALPGMEADSNAHNTARLRSDDATPASSQSALDALLDEYRARAKRANDIEGAKALLRLFGAYEEIEKIQFPYDQVRKEVDALSAMAKGKYSNYIKFTTKKERNAPQKELLQARSEAKQLRTHADLDLFDAERRAREEQALRRSELRPLTQQLDEINNRLTIVNATLAGQTQQRRQRHYQRPRPHLPRRLQLGTNRPSYVAQRSKRRKP